ncbi:MAG: type I-B CRISPR-associated protein Cas5b [Thermoplasmata archaeon]
MEFVAFEIWSDYAHFRKGYTTTSPLTYQIPSRTALSGIIAAILGLPRDSYYDELLNEKNSAIALQILKPIKKVSINRNLVDTKSGFWGIEKPLVRRTQIVYEYIKEPKYRLFVWLSNNEKFEELKKAVMERKTVYTIYMGTSEHIAQFSPYEKGFFEAELRHTDGDVVEIHSVVPSEKANIIIDQNDKDYVYGFARVPGFMNKNRVVRKYIDIYFEENGRPLKINKGDYYNIGGKINIIPF